MAGVKKDYKYCSYCFTHPLCDEPEDLQNNGLSIQDDSKVITFYIKSCNNVTSNFSHFTLL